MRELDRRASEEFGIPQEKLMEAAGTVVAREALKILGSKGPAKKAKVLALCGGGNNGGDGFVAARVLHKRGVLVRVLLLKPRESLSGPALKNFLRLKEEKISCMILPKFVKIKQEIAGSDLVLDALLGTGLQSHVRGPILRAISELNRSRKTVLAVDIPSGLDADKGVPLPEAVRAAATVTFGALKKGMTRPSAKKFLGRVAVADIGFPKTLMKSFKKFE